MKTVVYNPMEYRKTFVRYFLPSPFFQLSIVFFFLFSCFQANAFDQSPAPTFQRGVLDLRQVDLSKNSIDLDGEWGLYWHSLINPKDSSAPPVYTEFPRLWSRTIINGKSLPSEGYASYTALIILPHNHPKLALELPDTYTSYRLFINGEEFSAMGNPDSVKEKAVPRWQSKTIELTTTSDSLRLVLHIANFWHSRGGPYKKMRLGDKDILFQNRDDRSALDLILTGCLLMGGLFFFGLFLFGKHDKVLLYFSLFCITYSYRIIGTDYYVLHTLLPNIPWTITIHFEYLTLFISVIFFSFYTLELYPEDTNKKIVWLGVWISAALALIVITLPPSIFTQLINPFLLYMFGFIFYTFYVYVKAWRNKRVGANYAVASTGVICLVFLLINLQYFRLIAPQKAYLFAGYISFFFLQSLILSYRFAYTLTLAKKQAEEGLKAKIDFLSTMSHEIRTPLNSVLGMTHIILRNNPREEQKEQLDLLLFSANNLLAIVNDILDYNKIEAGKIQFESIEMDLVKLARNIVSGLRNQAEDKGITLSLKIDPALQDDIFGDPTRTGQVITNLVNNAIKFTMHGGVVLHIIVKDQTDNMVTITVRIEDSGIGIAPDKQKMIFEEFTQADTSTSRNFGGTGLGLAICKKILRLQGSSLQLVSEPGKGSAFYFTQTFHKVKADNLVLETSTNRLPAEETKPLTGISILLVEDNEINILVAKTFLEKWGATIDVAMNGQEAVDMLDTEKHKLVFMDLHMPVMDGYEATRLIREKGIRLPIIALTASLPKEIENKIKGNGITDIVVKPFVPDELYRIVLHYTGVHESTAS